MNKSSFGCQQSAVCKVVSLHLGEEIKNHFNGDHVDDDGVDVRVFKTFSLAKRGGTSVLILQPGISGDDAYGLETDDDYSSISDGEAVIGTKEDCSKFISKLSAAQLERYFSFLELV